MEATIGFAYWWDGMSKAIQEYVRTCPVCQRAKRTEKKYGKLPLKIAEDPIPWQRVNVDLIGPLSAKTPDGKKHSFDALTMIDPATGWFEVVQVKRRTAEVVAAAFDDTWLSRYPRPKYIGYDNGGENKGLFKEMIKNYGLKGKPSSLYNPQSNGIIERVHEVLNNILRTFELEQRELDEDDPWTEFLSAAAFAIRATYHTTLGASPGQLVFGRDMILPITIEANWQRIKDRRQAEMRRNNDRENAQRITHTYHIDDKVLIKHEGILRKLARHRDGPFKVTQVYNNGTVRIQRGPVSERVNIRRIIPFRERREQ